MGHLMRTQTRLYDITYSALQNLELEKTDLICKQTNQPGPDERFH